MPNSSNSGGPWGGGGNNGGDDNDRNKGQRPGNQPPQVPDLEDLVRKGQEQLKVLMGGGRGNGPRRSGGAQGPGKGVYAIGALVLVGIWLFASFYTLKPEERSVEFMFGKFSAVGEPGLNFAPWPIVTKEVVQVTRENTEDIGVGGRGTLNDQGLMLTSDENIVDIDFQVVWNINDPAKYLFNLQNPQETIRAMSESAMREVIGRSKLAPILNKDRKAVSDEVLALIQDTLDSYDSGVNIVRLNFDKADPPTQVIDSFRDVQAAEQERDTLVKQSDAYANQTLAAARGEAAQLLQQAEGYRAKVVNEATGEASRFTAVYEEYLKAKVVTRKRLYLETMQRILANVDKIIIDDKATGTQGVLPYLPLNQLNGGGSN